MSVRGRTPERLEVAGDYAQRRRTGWSGRGARRGGAITEYRRLCAPLALVAESAAALRPTRAADPGPERPRQRLSRLPRESTGNRATDRDAAATRHAAGA